ncbi:MAG TPA: hypothetical protein VMH84_13170 [Xanthobacteraceae bacterium]|nr:hypothetical protein [Xanthobacteraceae bacterium]
MFKNFPQSELSIVAADGTIRHKVKGIIDSKLATIPDPNVVIHTGDEIRRILPNGTEEVFEVLDPVFYQKMHGVPAHFQVKIRRKGEFPKGTGGNFTIHISGPNARVNISSTDNSHNIVANRSVFGDLKTAIEKSVPVEEHGKLLTAIERMERGVGNRPALLQAYQDFMSSAANHMTVIAPFLPALTKLLSP